MSHLPIVPQSDFQRLVVEQALAFAVRLEQAAGSAPHGEILDRCERATLEHGRQLLRDCLAAALQQRVLAGEKKGRPPASVPADRPAGTKAPTRASS